MALTMIAEGANTDSPKTLDTNLHEGVTAILLSYKRPHNIPRIIEEMVTVNFIKEIIVWNNNPDLRLTFSNCKVINSNHNFMPFARYACALLASQRTILFQDDDLLFEKNAIEYSYDQYLRDRTRLYGAEGRNLRKGNYVTDRAFGECDIVLGQFMIFDKRLLADVLPNILRLTPIDRGDDIAFSMLCKTKPFALGLEYQNMGIQDEHALYRQVDHGRKRQQMVDRVLELKKSCPDRGPIHDKGSGSPRIFPQPKATPLRIWTLRRLRQGLWSRIRRLRWGTAFPKGRG